MDFYKTKTLQFCSLLRNWCMSLRLDFKSMLVHTCFVMLVVWASIHVALANDGSQSIGTESNPTSDGGIEACNSQNPDGCQSGPVDNGVVPISLVPGNGIGNPINLMSGNKFQSEHDFSLPDSQLMFNRMYNSNAENINVDLGMGWRHSYALSIADTGEGGRVVMQSNGVELQFSADGTDTNGAPLMRGTQNTHGYLVQHDNRHEWYLPDGRTLKFLGRYLTEISWSDQRKLTLFYRDERLRSVTDETGRTMLFDYTPGRDSGLNGYTENRFGSVPGHLEALTLPDGSVIGYDYDNKKNLTRVRFPDGTSREYHYENEAYTSHLTGITDRTGVRYASWEYDDHGRAIMSEHADGRQRVTLEYPHPNDVVIGAITQTKVTNSLGQQSTYSWVRPGAHSSRQLLRSEGVGCSTCPPTGFAYEYDEQGRLLSKTRTGDGSSSGVVDTRYVYDEQGRLSETWYNDELSRTWLHEKLEYEENSIQPSRRIKPSVKPDAEQVTQIERNDRGLPVKVSKTGFAPQVDSAGNTVGFTSIEHIVGFEYEDGRLTGVDGPRDDVDDITRFAWDAQNRMVRMTQPGNPPLHITEFDAFGRAVNFVKGTKTDPIGSPVSLSYNASSQVQSITQSGRTLNMAYDAEGKLTRVINRVGRQMDLRYDDAGQLISIEYVGGEKLKQEYDDEGRHVAESLMDRYGDMLRSVSKLYDAKGRVASITRELTVNGVPAANSQAIDFDYDAYNRPVRAVEQETENSIGLQYNAFGNLSGFTGPDDKSIELGFDNAGNAISLTDIRNNKTEFLQDDFGRVVAVSNSDVGVSQYEYDAAGNRVGWTNPTGNTTRYLWDAANRPTLVSGVDGDTHYSYDTKTGLLAETSNKSTTERFSYTRDARMLRHERIIDGRSFVSEYRYDDQGRLSGRDLPGGQTLRYHYYENGVLAGQLRAVTRSSFLGLQQEVLLAEIDEDPSDGITGFIAHNGKRTTRRHASDGRIKSIEVSDTLTLAYHYDEYGRIIGIDENSIGQKFAYSKGFLNAASTLTGSYLFNYDDAGNRTADNVLEPDGAYVENRYQYANTGQGNRLVALTGGDTQEFVELKYNASGSPLIRGNLRYEYNNNQRPVRIFKDGTLLAEYSYNSFGERIKKVSYSADQKRITYFLYDGNRISAEISVDNAASKTHVAHTLYLQHQPVVYFAGENTYAIHTDNVGTPHILSDDAGLIAWQAHYTPFGKATQLVEDIEFKHRFPGQYEDSETGTHYNYQRDYDPETGRYLTSDPLSVVGGVNTYLYAKADPLNSTDVLGLSPGLPTIDGNQGTIIDGDQYELLVSHAAANQGQAYFTLLFELTGHPLYEDFANSYNPSFTPSSIYLLRELYLYNGVGYIDQVTCGVDGGTPTYEIPDVNLFSELIFQRAGIQRAAVSFVVEAGTGLLSLGQGLVNLSLDLSGSGVLFDLLRDWFPERDLPEWLPSFADGQQTIANAVVHGIEIGKAIREDKSLLWRGITDPIAADWAAGRYAESITTGVLEIGSMFAGIGVVAKVGRLASLFSVLKRVDAAVPGEFDRNFDKILDEFDGDVDQIRQVAEQAGVLSDVNASLLLRGYPDVPNSAKDRINVKDVTTPGANIPNYRVDKTKQQFEDYLSDSGFDKSVIDTPKGPINVFSKDGQKVFTTRDFSRSTDGPSGKMFNGGKTSAKIRFKRDD